MELEEITLTPAKNGWICKTFSVGGEYERYVTEAGKPLIMSFHAGDKEFVLTLVEKVRAKPQQDSR